MDLLATFWAWYEAAPTWVLFAVAVFDFLLTILILPLVLRWRGPKDKEAFCMSDEDLERARDAGREFGKIIAKLEELMGADSALGKRISRIENAIIAALAALAYFYLKSIGVLP